VQITQVDYQPDMSMLVHKVTYLWI
jgi:hypothetical protein